ncbi:NADPH-dependent oxidoreductase [Enterococcus sp. CSURQ0835]|uniref:NADPH-dependent oxidoreductase n=1 Tax=Enterococcus sp. CSURQ0835 TaxID=2681394 RepID=UPI001359CEF8|nr:NADPH-dependent oxidoreductase [Enterococcus sp. CSURQ0835]
MELFDQMLQHTSVRSFEARKVPSELKAKLVAAAQSGASSNFLQAYSVIEVRDPKKLAQLEKIAHAPGYVKDSGVFYLFVADLNKHAQVLQTHAAPLTNLKSIESLTVAIVDTTIAAQNMAVFAESSGLRICYIGGIRNDVAQVAKLLELPALTYPLFGLTIGYPKHKNEVKPRLPADAVVAVDRYQLLTAEKIARYDETMATYYATRSTNATQASWSQKVLAHFEIPRRPEIRTFLAQQGFEL